jgi:hypothetical protein
MSRYDRTGRRGDAQRARQPVRVEQPARLGRHERDQAAHLSCTLDVGDLLDVAADDIGQVALEEAPPTSWRGAPHRLRVAAPPRPSEVVGAPQADVVGAEIACRQVRGVDEAVRPAVDLALRQGPQLDGLRPTRKCIGKAPQGEKANRTSRSPS